jgi:hypothetical protein
MAASIDINITELNARVAELNALFEDNALAKAYGELAAGGFAQSKGKCTDDLGALIEHFSMLSALTGLLIQRSIRLLDNAGAAFVAADEQLAAEMQAQG